MRRRVVVVSEPVTLVLVTMKCFHTEARYLTAAEISRLTGTDGVVRRAQVCEQCFEEQQKRISARWAGEGM